MREKNEAKRGSDSVTQKNSYQKRRNCVNPGTVFFFDGTYQQLCIQIVIEKPIENLPFLCYLIRNPLSKFEIYFY